MGSAYINRKLETKQYFKLKILISGNNNKSYISCYCLLNIVIHINSRHNETIAV